ncbi:MAG: alpha/beta hydrolase fold domain-containing protein [Deltaproteobacteria bacterium]
MQKTHSIASSWLERARVRAGAVAVDGFFTSLSRLGKLHPQADPARHDVEVLRDIAYATDGRVEHRLDVYRPRGPSGPRPAVLYVHGGGFRILSKETHWIMGLAFARRGFVVFNINYRLAPQHPYPAALEDACAAYAWVVENGARYGADLSRLVVAGESAGANLATSVTVASAYRRPEPFARAVFDTDVRPVAALPACGVLQVSDPKRFSRRRPLPAYIQDRLDEVSNAYLAGAPTDAPGGIELADPLVVLERGATPDRPLAPFFAAVGTRDPLLDDTRRLKTALDRLGVRCEVRFYAGEVHAFHALVFRANAVRAWRDTFTFVEDCLAPAAVSSVQRPG